MAKKKKEKRKNSRNIQNKLRGFNNKVSGESTTISVCLIVKDEERFLENCLNSVKDMANEIIIIDTGSQDNTVNIAKKYTDKVYLHPWQDSYSEARNHYLEYAEGDWIFQIDADEELVKEDIPVLLKALRNPNIDLFLIPIICHLEKGDGEGIHNGERLFRNNGIIRYKGRIHERLSGYKKAEVIFVRLIHYGYDLKDDDLSEEKNQRRIRLLNMDIQDNPDDPLPYHYLSCCYLYRDLFDETLGAGLKAIELAEKNNNKDPVFLWTRYNTAMAYYELKDFKNAVAMALSAIMSDKRHMDSYYILTAIYFDQSKWPEVLKYGNEYLHLNRQIKNRPENLGTMVTNSFGSLYKVQILMGIAFHETGDTTKSEEMFRSALLNVSDPFKALKAIGMYYYNKTMFTQSQEYLKRAWDLNKEDSTVKDLLDKIRSGGQTLHCDIPVNDKEHPPENAGEDDIKEDPVNLDQLLSLYIAEGKLDKAMDIIQNHSEKINVTGSMLCQTAVLYLEKGGIESATKCYMTAIEKDNDLFEAWASLGELMLAVKKIEDSRIFFEKALSIKKDDIRTILNLCDIASIEADILKVIEYCDLLLRILYLPNKRTLNSLDDLQAIMYEIGSVLSDNSNYQNHINAITGRISMMKNQSV